MGAASIPLPIRCSEYASVRWSGAKMLASKMDSGWLDERVRVPRQRPQEQIGVGADESTCPAACRTSGYASTAVSAV